MFENISDAILNAFAKIKNPDPKYVEMKESIDKFEESLNGVEKTHSKLLKSQAGISVKRNAKNWC